MPTREKTYWRTFFQAETIQAAKARFAQLVGADVQANIRTISPAYRDRWVLDTEGEWFAMYDQSILSSQLSYTVPGQYDKRLSFGSLLLNSGPSATAEVTLPSREQVSELISIFDAAAPDASVRQPVTIFIGHGQSPAWRDLQEHLQDHHRLVVRAFESAPRAGQHIKEILEDEVTNATFAVLVHTAEDEQADERMRARQNVVHETGLFQGALGWNRAVILRERGCDEFSNVHGIQEIRFADIRETFGEVLAVIRREFPGALR